LTDAQDDARQGSHRGTIERLALYASYILLSLAVLSSFAAIYYILNGISVVTAAGSAAFYSALGYVARTYSNKKRLERIGEAVPGGTRRILEMATAAGLAYVTIAILGGMDYSLSLTQMSSETEITMLNDLIIFQGVLIGFLAVLIGQGIRDLLDDAEQGPFPPGLRPLRFHRRRLAKHRSDVYSVILLLVGAFVAWLSIPWAAHSPNVGYVAVPLQFTVMGVSLLLLRMGWYR
jgi:TRAP-type C4-dicarboxylate transport system permease small subunit